MVREKNQREAQAILNCLEASRSLPKSILHWKGDVDILTLRTVYPDNGSVQAYQSMP